MRKSICLVILYALASSANAQNVGIGNTVPVHKLDLSGRMRIRGGADNFNSAGIWLAGSGTDSAVNKAFVGMNTNTTVGIYGATGAGWSLLVNTDNGNTGIGTNTLDKAGLTVDNKAGAVHALFGSNAAGIAIESDFPGIGFNSYFSDARRLLSAGFGAYIGLDYINGGMRFSVSPGAGSAGSTISLNPALYLSPGGNIGIGNLSPAAPLSFSNVLGKKISLYPGSTGDAGFAVFANELRQYTDHANGNITFGFDNYTNGFTERMRIKANGNVGIGNSSPNAPLQFGNSVQNRKIVMYESGNNDHQFYGFGINASVLRYQVPSSVDDHVFFAGTGTAASDELVRIKGNGNVGIGVSDPAYRLDIAGRMRIRSETNNGSGIWFNNIWNTEVRGFIGMYDNDLFGLYGDAGAGWAFTMSTSNGDIQASGNTSINGYTRIGDTGPSIKTKLITGTTPLLGEALIPHGLDKSKIIGFQAVVTTVDGVLIPPGYWFGVGLSYEVQIDNNYIRIVLPLNPVDYLAIINKPFKIYITYTN